MNPIAAGDRADIARCWPADTVVAQKVRDGWMADGIPFSSSLILFAVGLTKAPAAVSPPRRGA